MVVPDEKKRSIDWEEVSFLNPAHSSLDYVYSANLDTAVVTIFGWTKVDGMMPSAFRVKLADVQSFRFIT